MTNPFKKYRIDRLFFQSFALVIIIFIALIAWTGYSLSSKSLVRTTSHYQQQLLDELNNEITTRMVTIEQISLSTSRDNELITFLRDNGDEYDRYRRYQGVQHALANLTYSIPLIQGIDLYMEHPFQGDDKSYIQFHDLSELKKWDLSQYLQKNDFAWSEEHEVSSFQGHVPVLSFARKIMYENTYLGVLVIHIKAKEIQTLLAGHSEGSNRIMTDGEGRQLLKIGNVLDQKELEGWIDTRREESSGYVHIQSGQKQEDSLLVYSRLPNSNWTLIEITSWKQITASSFRLAEIIGFIGVIAILFVLLLTHLLSRQFTKPIKKLVTAMRMYSVGGQQPELPTDYENEFGYLFAGYRKQNERIEELYLSLQRRYEQQRKAEIEALQANINPHFLYNMLDQLNWMAIEAGQDELSRILELTGRMFRIGLSNGDSFIPISEELVHIESYLEIQQLRRSGGLDYTIEVPEELGVYYMPKLTLQPFVENSIVHGFNKQSHGHIRIRMEHDNERLRIVIEDNGTGLKRIPPETPPQAQKRRTGGYGIRNVKERIDGYFGNGYGVKLSERPEGGTKVDIVLPLLAHPPNKEESAS
ncbi:cache domain-containing sensor histidine kinase [Paenibacillus physcomitrellae]|uniref:cache domain-containing sensor histidine kinase n=1 Tax=Paenibacillus physcomitrellae TaxID=1619311 RepID=UPI000B8C84E6|nr:sensor histidine kinase [Paenibacillus physcomitrellae]